MPTKLFITDERMLLLMEWAVQTNMVRNETEFMESIGFHRTNIRNVRTGHQGFTTEHILKALKLTGATADYIFGLTNVRLRKPSRKPMDMLKEAVSAVDLELKAKSNR